MGKRPCQEKKKIRVRSTGGRYVCCGGGKLRRSIGRRLIVEWIVEPSRSKPNRRKKAAASLRRLFGFTADRLPETVSRFFLQSNA
jgi:hypothetical protein